MNETTTKEVSRLAKFLSDRLVEIQGVRSQREIANIAGFTNANMITMLKQGYTKLALDRVGGLAKALDVNKADLMLLALEQFFDPATIREIGTAFTDFTDDERRIVSLWRIARRSSPIAVDTDVSKKVVEAFQAI